MFIVRHKYTVGLGGARTYSQRYCITPNTPLSPSYVICLVFDIVYQIFCIHYKNKIWQRYAQGTPRAGLTQTDFIAKLDYSHILTFRACPEVKEGYLFTFRQWRR